MSRAAPARRVVHRTLLCLGVLWIAFLALAMVGAAVPDRLIAQQLTVSINEGLYQRNYPATGLGGIDDSYTDCVVAGTGLGHASMPVWQRALLMPRIGGCDTGVEQIRAIVQGRDVQQSYYLRYWGGYASFFRPAIALGGMAAMNALALTLLVAGLFAMWWNASRAVSAWYAIALTFPLLVTTDVLVTPGGAAEHALSLAAAFGGVALVCWAAARRDLVAMTVAAVASGAVFNYVDLLNNPNLAWVLTAAVGGAVALARGRTPRRAALATAFGAAGWMVGYAGAFVERWLTAALAAGPRTAFTQVVELIGIRAGVADQAQYPQVVPRVGRATWVNVAYWSHMPTARLVAVLAIVVVVVLLVVAIGSRRLSILAYAAAAWPVLLVPLWYEVLRNHSQIHLFFMYRAVPAAVGVALGAAVAVVIWARRSGPVVVTPADAPGPDSVEHRQAGTDA